MDRTLERMLQKLSLPIRRQLQAVPASCWEQVQEIRLQQGREPYLVVAGRPMRLGQLLHRPISTEPVQPQQLQESFAALCDYSVHTCLPQLLEGYLTVEGGHRIGIGATAVIQNGRLCSVRQVSSLSRIASPIPARTQRRCPSSRWQNSCFPAGCARCWWQASRAAERPPCCARCPVGWQGGGR